MDNEQLVARIQAGENKADNMLQLWQQNRGFIATMARKYTNLAEMEDLEQEGYIYPVKGKGNFVTGNQAVREKKKQACFQKLEDCLLEGKEFGVTREDCMQALGRVYGEVRV